MVNRIRIVNVSTKKEIIVDKTDSSDSGYILENIDWDKPGGVLQSFRVPFQIGMTLLDVEIGTRAPTITGYVVASESLREGHLGQSWENYYSEQLEDIENKKNELNSLINMFSNIRVFAGSYYIEGRPTSPVIYSNNERENNEIICKFTIIFECVNPMFRMEREKVTSLTSVKKMFVFPWLIKKNGNVFAELVKRSLVNVVNNGDNDVGGVIVFSVIQGIVKNPRLFNATTGEYIEIDIEMEIGDRLTINTRLGEERVTHFDSDATGNKNKNAIMYVKEGSVFLQFRRGSWIYGYEVAEGGEIFVDLEVSLDEQYFNIREQ